MSNDYNSLGKYDVGLKGDFCYMKCVIGVLGGMGTFATIHMFQQYAEIFTAQKEWERPRIIIDNRCTMPSRVRAFLYNENVGQLVDEMTDSLQYFLNAGCNKIILACNTSHLFLPLIYKRIPELKGVIVDIIIACVQKVAADNVKRVFLLASEGTIDSKIYNNALLSKNIECVVPTKNEYFNIRKCIEAVKQNDYSKEVKEIFLELVNRYDACILGCTELPVLYSKYIDEASGNRIYDPLCIALQAIHSDFMG